MALAVALAACGGSGGSSSSAGSATNSANTTTQANGQRSGRFAALRACLQKEGINLPSRRSVGPPPSGGAGPLGFGGGGGFKLPAGVSQSKFQEAIKKCGGGFFGGGRRFSSAAGRAALVKFAQCMRENGVNVPEPNTSGTGPIFNTKGINTASSTFKAAESKCRSKLRGAFAAGGGQPGGGQPGGVPPGAGGGAPPPEGGGAASGAEGGG